MNRPLNLVALLLTCALSSELLGGPVDTVVFRDDFTGPDSSLPDPSRWIIGHPENPSGWWVQGRTFFPNPSQHPGAPFPHIQDGALVIGHYQYNPFDLGTPKTTFLGGEVHTITQFDTSQSYRFEARVRWPSAPSGLVTSFFTYGYDGAHNDSDEIDFEFLSNEVFEPEPQVLTNTWNDSLQNPVQVLIPELDLTEWQTFRMYWHADPGAPYVEWTWLDPTGAEMLLRRATEIMYIPDEPMSLYFNFWAPTADWPKAYDPDLQPDQQDNGVHYEYWIDYVEVVPEPASCILLAVGAAWLLARQRQARPQ